MIISKDKWLKKLKPIHRNFSAKAYKRIQTKLSNLIISLAKRRSKKGKYSITKDELEQKLYDSYGAPCIYCGKMLRLSKQNGIDCDHIDPLAGQGDTTAENLQFICHICNRRKDTLSHDDFKALLDWLDTQSRHLKLYTLGKLSKKRF